MKKTKPSGAPENTGVIYGRYSSDNQRAESIDAQIRACTEYAKSKGIDIVGIYTDAAKTGTNSDREQFQQMIEDSSKGMFRYLIIHKLDRFSRDRHDAAMYKRKLKINGVTVLSVLENLDGSPESIIMESVLEGMAEYYACVKSGITLSQTFFRSQKNPRYKTPWACFYPCEGLRFSNA